jgi:hypothetical protein
MFKDERTISMREPKIWYFLSFGSNRQHAGNLGYSVSEDALITD